MARLIDGDLLGKAMRMRWGNCPPDSKTARMLDYLDGLVRQMARQEPSDVGTFVSATGSQVEIAGSMDTGQDGFLFGFRGRADA